MTINIQHNKTTCHKPKIMREDLKDQADE